MIGRGPRAGGAVVGAVRRGGGWAYGNAYVLLPAAALAWAGNSIVGRAVADELPPVGVTFWRWVLALAVIAPAAWPRVRADAAALRAGWRVVAVLSVTGVAVFGTFLYKGLQTTTAINGSLLQSIVPVLTLPLAFLLFAERPGPAQLAGLVLSLLGVAVIVTRGHPLDIADTEIVAGDLWILAAVGCYALYSAALRRRPPVHPLSLLAVTFALAVVVLAPVYVAESLADRPMPVNGTAFAALAYGGLFPSLLAYFCFNRGVELVGPSRASQFIHLVPVFGVVLAVVFLDERPGAFQAAGGALVAAGIMLSARTARPSGAPA